MKNHKRIASLRKLRKRLSEISFEKLKQSVSRLVNILFPELETLVLTLHMASVYAILSEFPGAKQISSAHLTHFKTVLSEASKGRYDREKAVEIREAARTSKIALAAVVRRTYRTAYSSPAIRIRIRTDRMIFLRLYSYGCLPT